MKTLLNELFKKICKRPLLLPALSGIAGMFLCFITGSRIPSAVLAIILSSFSFVILIRAKKFGLTWLIPALAAFLQLAVFAYTANCFYTEPFPGASVFGDSIDIQAEGYVRSVRYKADGTVEALLVDRTYGRLLYRIAPDDGTYIPSEGELLSGNGKLKTAGIPSDPGQFDYASYLRKQGIRGSFEGDIVFDGSDFPAGSFRRKVNSVSFYVREHILSLFGEDRPLASAVFMGDTSLLDDEDTRAFRLSGCAHLLAVSGTHFTGFLMVLPFVLKKMRLKRPASVFCYASFCLLLGILTGWSPSVTRAAVMSLCAYSLKDKISAMALASCLLLVADPFSVLSSGFLMSFSAACAILYLGPVFKKRLRSGALAYTLAAMTGMMPFWIDIGVSISLSSLLVQMTASFIAQISCVLFTPCILLSLLFGSWTADIAVAPLRFMIAGVRAYSDIALYAPGSRSIGWVVISALFVFILVKALPRITVRDKLVKAGSLLLAVSFGLYAGSLIIKPSARIVFIDVGQGDSCLLMSGGKTVLIDGGTYEAGRSQVSTVLDYYSIPKVDVAFISHWDLDHAGGIVCLYEQGRVDRVFAPSPADTSGIDDMFDILDLEPIFYEGLCGGMSVTVGDMEFACIGPDNGAAITGSNEDSLVLLANAGGMSSEGGTTILFTGDIGEETEISLCARELISEVDILKVAHHGSRFSSCEEFLSAASPEYAVISAGRRNMYGHPTPETLDRLFSYTNAQVHCTAWEGAVFVDVYDSRLEVRGMVDIL